MTTTMPETAANASVRRVRGITLIELMVVIAIIGIIAAIAYPSYQNYVADTYKAQSLSDLKVCALALDRFYSNGFTYVGANTANVCNLNSPTTGATQYNITYQSLTISQYVIRATPVGGSCGSNACIELGSDGQHTEI